LTQFNQQFLLIQNHNEFEHTDENALCFDNNDNICDVLVQNVHKKTKLIQKEDDADSQVTVKKHTKCILHARRYRK